MIRRLALELLALLWMPVLVAQAPRPGAQATWARGIETPRITVMLATGIPEARCRRLNPRVAPLA